MKQKKTMDIIETPFFFVAFSPPVQYHGQQSVFYKQSLQPPHPPPAQPQYQHYATLNNSIPNSFKTAYNSNFSTVKDFQNVAIDLY